MGIMTIDEQFGGGGGLGFRASGNWDTSIGIVTSYGLDDQGSVPGRGKIFLFSAASRPDVGPTQPPVQWVLGALSLG
jgi:hypothetical protein